MSGKELTKILALSCLLVTTLFIGQGWSQEGYPQKPIKVFHFAAPGALDTMVRTISGVMEKLLGQPIIVDAKIGGQGAAMFDFIIKSKPDGYTLGIGVTSSYTNIPLMQKPPYNLETDTVDIAAFCRYSQFLLVGANTPWKTYEELLDYARKNPGKFKYATGGLGSSQHICMERIAMKEGIQWVVVPFRSGGAEAVTAALGGHVDGVALSPLETGAHIKAGKLRPLLVLTNTRVPDFPDVPTILEKGYDFTATGYMSFYGPKGLPERIRQKLEDTVKKAVQNPTFVETANRFQLGAVFMSGKDYGKYWRADAPGMEKAIKALGLEKK